MSAFIRVRTNGSGPALRCQPTVSAAARADQPAGRISYFEGRHHLGQAGADIRTGNVWAVAVDAQDVKAAVNGR